MRQLIRTEPLEKTTLDLGGARLTIPTEAEILRIKGVLILKRHATRDYLGFVALATHIGARSTGEALRPFDRDLAAQWRNRDKVKSACGRVAVEIFDHVCDAT